MGTESVSEFGKRRSRWGGWGEGLGGVGERVRETEDSEKRHRFREMELKLEGKWGHEKFPFP